MEQRILLEKDYVNQKGVFLPEELDALVSIAEHLCATLPDANNPFSFGIGTRRLTHANLAPQLELVLNHVKLPKSPHDQPNFYREECQQMLQTAAQPMSYFAGWEKAQEYCDPHENALKNGIIVHSDGMSFGSVKDEGGWFVLGLKFKYAMSLQSNVFATAFLASIVETIFAMDRHNEHLRVARAAFLESCKNWSISLPEQQLHQWLSEDNFSVFVRNHYERSGPRKFFG